MRSVLLRGQFPASHPQRMATDVGAAAPAASDDPGNADAVEPDAEVSFVTKDLGPILPKAKLAAVIALDEVVMRVRGASNGRGGSGVEQRRCVGRRPQARSEFRWR